MPDRFSITIDTEENDDWIKHVNPEHAKEEREIHERLGRRMGKLKVVRKAVEKADFKEEEHPRADDGEFAPKGEGGAKRPKVVGGRLGPGRKAPEPKPEPEPPEPPEPKKTHYKPAKVPHIKDVKKQAEHFLQGAPSTDDWQNFREHRAGRSALVSHLCHVQGFDDLPEVVDEKELKAVVEAGGVEMWRGVTDYEGGKAEEYAEQFRSGELYVGLGAYGSGTYTAGDPGVADLYGRGAYTKGESGAILHMALRPEARVIDFHSELRGMAKAREREADKLEMEAIEEMRNEAFSLQAQGKKIEAEKMKNAIDKRRREVPDWIRIQLDDVSRIAIMEGYDAIRVAEKDASPDAFYWVILNRTAVVVEKAKEKE